MQSANREDDTQSACAQILLGFARGEISAHMALVELLTTLEDETRIEQLLAAQPHHALRALWAENRASCVAMAAALRSQTPPPASESGAVDHARRLFDRLVRESEESSVAMYSLGNSAILAEATEELVRFLRARGFVHGSARVLDLGCGIGRVALALASEVKAIHGVDLSTAMIEVARRRCAACENVCFSVSTGVDLHDIAAASQTLVLAIDSFPYVVDAGEALVSRMFAEVRRTLVPGGRFVIFNFSYRELAQDLQDVHALAERHGFSLQSAGDTPLELWNGRLFALTKDREALTA